MRFPHPCTITKPGRVSDKYNPQAAVKDWDNPASVVVTTGWWQPYGGGEDEVGGNIQVGDGQVFLPAGTDVAGDDRVTVVGLTFDVVGPPEKWQSGGYLSATDHVRARLRRVSG